MATTGHHASYACRCLNVRIHPCPPQGDSPSAEPDFEPVFVGDEGVSVVHIQLTLRSRTRPIPHEHDELATRYMTLTCLLCHCLAYRVRQAIHPTLDPEGGPVLPNDDWAEQDLLKSISGWIEVSKSCLTGEAISHAEASPSYSKLFRLVLPSGAPSFSFPTPSSPSSPRTSPQVSGRHLPPLPPLFSPPPFTPSHPVFIYLSSIAVAESERVRDSAEQYIAKIVQENVAEIKSVEAGLREGVELLWSKFKEELDRIDQHGALRGRPSSSMSGRRVSNARWGATGPGAGHDHDEVPSSDRISSFVPIHGIAPRTSSAISPHQVTSALSASLALAFFHHPRAQHEEDTPSARDAPRQLPSPRGTSPSPGRSSTTRVPSPSATSSRTIAMDVNDESSTIREAYRRNMDESKDIATSFKYALDVEEQMRENGIPHGASDQQEASSSANVPGTSARPDVPRGRSPRASKSSIKKGKEKEKEHDKPHPSAEDKRTVSPGGAIGEVKEGSSKKRKVTFDVKPEVAIIDTDTIDGDVRPEEEETIFDMEDEDITEGADVVRDPGPMVNGKASTIPAPEPPRPPIRRPHSRIQDSYGLPSSLSALRPSSLPNFSSMQPPPPHKESADRPRSEVVRELVIPANEGNKRSTVNGHHVDEDVDEAFDPREAEILRLVAASAPSHRNAWKRDSKAWRLFVNRQNRRSREPGPVTIEEEEENDATNAAAYAGPRLGGQMDDDDPFENGRKDEFSNHEPPIASSLPIPIARNGPQFGSASYQPKTSLTERPGILVPPLHVSSSAATRRAVYAERDRRRPIDPGALDFIDDLDDDEMEVGSQPEVGSVGHRRALQILEARNAMPDAGMWRSLV